MGHKVGGRREVLAPPDEGCRPKPEVPEVAEPAWAAPGTTLQLGVSDTRLSSASLVGLVSGKHRGCCCRVGRTLGRVEPPGVWLGLETSVSASWSCGVSFAEAPRAAAPAASQNLCPRHSWVWADFTACSVESDVPCSLCAFYRAYMFY